MPPRHVDVGEHDPDVGPGDQQGDGLVGVGGLNRVEAGLLDHVHGVHAQDRFVLNDEDDGTWPGGRCHRVVVLSG